MDPGVRCDFRRLRVVSLELGDKLMKSGGWSVGREMRFTE